MLTGVVELEGWDDGSGDTTSLLTGRWIHVMFWLKSWQILVVRLQFTSSVKIRLSHRDKRWWTTTGWYSLLWRRGGRSGRGWAEKTGVETRCQLFGKLWWFSFIVKYWDESYSWAKKIKKKKKLSFSRQVVVVIVLVVHFYCCSKLNTCIKHVQMCVDEFHIQV